MALSSDSIPTLDDWLIVDDKDDRPADLKAASLDTNDGENEGVLPLASRSVEVDIDCESGLAEVAESFRYFADSDCSATFKFPMPSKSAVCG